jgi:hypothetical protein
MDTVLANASDITGVRQWQLLTFTAYDVPIDFQIQ